VKIGGNLAGRLGGSVIWKDDDGYERTRTDLVWQERKPTRYPDGIVRTADIDDVVTAVRWAREHGKQVSVRSGGHSWAGTSVRDGGLLIDLSGLDELSIDVDAMRAVIGPGHRDEALDAKLAEQCVFFPVGHCASVGIAGFTIGGGYGWWSQHYGQACLNIEAVDVVTAEGELIHADREQNPDYFWAVRGSGPGFFGVVVRFYARLHRRLPVVMDTMSVFALDLLDDVFRWAWDVRSDLSGPVELVVLPLVLPGGGERVLMVGGSATAESEAEGRELLAPIAACPLLPAALDHVAPRVTTMKALFDTQEMVTPTGYRYAVDNLWTSKSADEMLPFLHEAIDNLPTDQSSMMWYHWPAEDLPTDAALLHADVLIFCYVTYEDGDRDAEYQSWVTALMAKYQHLSEGTQCSDENFGARFFQPLTKENMEKLERLRDQHDPKHMFHGFPHPA